MPAYSFMKRFVPDVESGIKEMTFRNKRKRYQTKPGDLLSLYTGMRTKFCKLIMKVICTFVHPATITEEGIFINHRQVKDNNKLAQCDGFKNWEAMVEFWKTTHSLPWCGELISWGKKDPVDIFCK